ncbi:glycosyltransferase [Umezawaea tangerina]|uniref:Cellulose synthase/poly-beta-1,6-N-acetylglucosamine synthase-like glycosyltransferase n=1 Tax=Umezawaea tangerina TaxID=84725 RepID=A0A2T0SZC8_9PSEU|nr:glycosyltransferase [Umezawaea tangerina]PRY38771.1 cellulose synthase/poly-beta-1,6-N-acetylglucosamine synthase-like glycosyltransferase [Umezawaea tangerina]
MIAVLLLALLVLGVSLALSGAAALVRGPGRAPAAPDTPFRSDARDVAVLIAAHDQEHLVGPALEAAARLVPPANVHLVSDDSADRTAEVARATGAQVAETVGRLGRSGAFDAGIQAFRLVDRFEFVVLLDADTVLHPDYLDSVLPLFADETVVAVDGRLDPDLRTPPRGFAARLLSAYRARDHALVEGLRRFRRGGTPMNVARVLPSVGRVYRTSALWEIDIHSSGLAVDDFDTTLRIYREKFGAVAFSPAARAAPAGPTRLREHRRQLFLWANGFWQGLRGHDLRRDPGLAAQAVELALTAFALLLAPVAIVVAAVPGLVPVSPFAVAAALSVPDYLLTLVVALARRKPGYLLPGLLFPVLRVLDAATVLRGAFGHPSAAEWLRVGAEPEDHPVDDDREERVGRSAPVDRPARTPRAASVLAWFILAGSAGVLAVRVALTTATLPATSVEPGLVDATFAKVVGLGAPPVDGSLRVFGLQLDAYATLTGAFGRQVSTLVSARELSVAAVVVVLLALGAMAALLRIRPLVMAVAVLMLAAAGPVVAVLTPVGPGGTAAAWTALAAAAGLATVHRHDGRWVPAGAVALLVALATAPVLVVPIGVGTAVWFASAARKPFTRVWTALGALAVTAAGWLVCREAGLLAPPSSQVVLGDDQRVLLLAVVGAAVLAGLSTAWLRPVAVASGTGALLVVVAAPGADAVLPVLVLTAATLVALVVDESVGRFPAAAPARVRWVVGGMAAVLAVVGSAAGVVLAPRTARAVDHVGLAEWMAKNLDGDTGLAAPAGLWSDLQRDRARAGLPADAVRPAGSGTARPDDLVAAVGPTAVSGVDLVRFGSAPTDPDSIVVVLPRDDVGYLSSNERAAAGEQLAGNVRLHTTEDVRTALRAGRVDLRAMAVLAELCRAQEVTVASTGKPPHEKGSSLPDRTLVLSTADDGSTAAVVDWLKAQQPPFAPDEVRVVPDGVAIGWRLPPLRDRTPK